jgi:hypothetical protein
VVAKAVIHCAAAERHLIEQGFAAAIDPSWCALAAPKGTFQPKLGSLAGAVVAAHT